MGMVLELLDYDDPGKIIRPSLQLITRTTYPPNTTHIIDDNLTFNS